MSLQNNGKTSEVKNVKINSGLFGRMARQIKEEVLPHQWDILNDRADVVADNSIIGDDNPEFPSHCIANFRIAAGEEEGDFYGMVFQDTDLAKWIEAVSYQLMSDPNPELEKTVDEAIDLIGRAQQEDGYINTYFIIKEPENKFKNLMECHELYVAGHMIEAAVAYYRATGKKKFLDIMSRMVDCIDSKLGPASEGKMPGYPGHQEIELALAKMYQITGNEKHIKLAKYFIDQRGKEPLYFIEELKRNDNKAFFANYFPPNGMYSFGKKYAQYHEPIRDQKSFVGHAVRCMYMASSMADIARITEDKELFEACKALYENMVERRMYITGGIGSSRNGERFTFDYDLPNDLVYAETCASIGVMFFMQRMLLTEQDSSYADTMERALYNTCIAGIALDGKGFFYVNPLEVSPEACKENPDYSHVLPVRPSWFGCACCPPNLARMLTSLGEYIYTIKGDDVYVNLYIGNEAKLDTRNGEFKLHLQTDFPNDGNVQFTVSTAGNRTIYLRIPNWSMDNWSIKVNGKQVKAELVNGYAKLAQNWNEGDTIELILDMECRRVYTNPRVKDNQGKVAIQRGPFVYCLEEVDNGKGLQQMYLPSDAKLSTRYMPEKLGGIVEVNTTGLHLVTEENDSLYSTKKVNNFVEKPLTFIPYYTWANRGENEMLIWIREK